MSQDTRICLMYHTSLSLSYIDPYINISCKETFALPETNVAFEHPWLEDDFPFGMAYFQRLH